MHKHSGTGRDQRHERIGVEVSKRNPKRRICSITFGRNFKKQFDDV